MVVGSLTQGSRVEKIILLIGLGLFSITAALFSTLALN